jgi:lipoyl(octanoyl) transferase
MAKAVAEVLSTMGIAATWRRDRPGLWVGEVRDGEAKDGEAKICAVGVHVRQRVAIHGFALNVSNCPEDFDLIVPCGLPGARVTSIARELGGTTAIPPMHVLASRVARAFGEAIGTTFVPALERCALDPFVEKIELSNGITRMIGA